MGERVRMFAWTQTPLGAIQGWPQSLITAAAIVLDSKVPHVLTWGSDLVVCAYNDAYRPLLGAKPEALGRPFLRVWTEAEDSLTPLIEGVLKGESQYFEEAPFTLMRHGTAEQTYFDFSLTPVRNEAGEVAGMLNTGREITAEVIAAREREERLRIIRTLSQAVWEAEADGRYIRDASAWRACTGQTYEQWRQDGWLGAVYPEDRERARARWQHALATGGNLDAQVRVRTAEGG